MSTAYDRLRPLMQRARATHLAPQQFYWEVNAAYHAAEARVYDAVHSDMFRALLPKWARLVRPLVAAPAGSLRWLDVGCGTGLVGSFLAPLLGERIGEAVLLDPSPAMLDRCRARSGEWPFRARFTPGTIEAVANTGPYHLVTTNSVLHHVVELEAFCGALASLTQPGGYVLTCQDPRAEAQTDAVLAQRLRAGRRPVRRLARRVRRLAGRALRRVLRRADLFTELAAHTNQQLLDKQVTGAPLPLEMIWAITDFHVPGQPGGIGAGISLATLRGGFAGLVLDDYFTYSFFGDQPLSRAQAEREAAWFEQGDPHGTHFGSRWRRPQPDDAHPV